MSDTMLREKLLLGACGLGLVVWAALAWYGLYRLIAGCPHDWATGIPPALLQ